MIGNDLVDLKLASKQSNWQRRGFLNKLFSIKEQECILDSDDPFKTVWLLWSMKESAYKAYIQTKGERFFSPKKLLCSLISKNKGTVLINNFLYFTETEINSDFIHTVAISVKHNNSFSSNSFKFEDATYETQHQETHQKVLAAFANKLKLPITLLKIKKNTQGIPQLFQDEMLLKNSFSLTHHGQFGAFCIGY